MLANKYLIFKLGGAIHEEENIHVSPSSHFWGCIEH